MADKLSDVLNKLTEKKNDAFKEVLCPSCAAAIRLYAKMDYGYCRFCAGKVSLRDAQNGKISKQLIDHLSGDEYYALMRDGKGKEENIDENVAKTAFKKGSLTAALDLGWMYIDDSDYQTAMRYLKIADDGGNEEGRVLYLLCKDEIAYESGNLLLSDANEMLSVLNAISPNKLSNRCRKFLKYVRDKFKEAIDSTNESFYKKYKAAEAAVKQRQAASSSYRSSREWNDLNDDLDAVQRAMNSEYGSGWGKDL